MAKSTKKATTHKKSVGDKPKPKSIGWGIDQTKYGEARRKS